MNTAFDRDRITMDVHLTTQKPEGLYEEIRAGLQESPRRLPTKYLYDDYGSKLFEQICELPEYYQTRTEHGILSDYAEAIVDRTEADELVELGSGASTKTRVLLDAMARANRLRYYVPFDVSEGIVRRVAHELVSEYPSLHVHGVIGDFLSHMEHIPDGGKRLVAFLGGTIGNLEPAVARQFLISVSKEMSPGDYLLLGVQFVTSVERLEAAYNDSAGVSAQFNKNILSVIKNLTGADFDQEAFEHRAIYNQAEHRIEMRLRSRRDQVVRFPALDWEMPLIEGEEILTEISTKYTPAQAEALVESAGFQLVNWYTDPHDLLGLALVCKSS